MTTASPVIEIDWGRGPGAPLSWRAYNADVVTLVSALDEMPLAAGSARLEDFLEKFEARPDIAPHLPAAKAEIAESFRNRAGGETLRTLRINREMSQSDLAKAIGSSQARVSRLETGQESATEHCLRKLSQALGVDFNTLMDALSRAGK